MPRRNVPFIPNQYYHFYNRGNNRQPVFFERENYLYFLRGLKKYLTEQVDIIAYCLMPTHYHILAKVKPPLQTSEFCENSEVLGRASVSEAMMRLGVSYTKAVNKRFSRVGSLFQGQFQGKLVQQTKHLLNLCVYIHANPVKDGLVTAPESWEFSNYLEWMNLREGTLVNHEFIRAHFHTSQAYQALVMEFIRTRYLPDEVRKYFHELEG